MDAIGLRITTIDTYIWIKSYAHDFGFDCGYSQCKRVRVCVGALVCDYVDGLYRDRSQENTVTQTRIIICAMKSQYQNLADQYPLGKELVVQPTDFGAYSPTCIQYNGWMCCRHGSNSTPTCHWLVGWLVGNRGRTVVQCIKTMNNCRPHKGTVTNKSLKCCPFNWLIFVSFSENMYGGAVYAVSYVYLKILKNTKVIYDT